MNETTMSYHGKELQEQFETTVSTPEYQSYVTIGEKWCVLAPKTVADMVHEGKTLQHAIAYWSRAVARGVHKVYFLRHSDAPDVPFMTMDILDGVLIECSGLNNSQPTDEVREYLTSWAKDHGLGIELSLH